MGLLDDAIREHLDLKRRRGADPGEVERDEREALGPVRRIQAPENAEVDEAADSDAMDFEHEAEPPEGIAFDHGEAAPGAAFDHEADDESWSFEHEAPEHEAGAPADEPEASYAPESAPADSVGQETAVHRPDFLDAEAVDEPDFEPRRDAPPPHPAAGETVQYDVERHLGGSDTERGEGEGEGEGKGEGEGEDEGEELLEETPEFLQDTPDHDRLWFEQRPPKDFDFDG
jgi:hypothetical protein